MAGVDHRTGIDMQRTPLEAPGVRVQASLGGQPAELRAQLGPLVGDQPGIQPREGAAPGPTSSITHTPPRATNSPAGA
jgi:hypothetical protein